jgi:putative hemolysin
MTRIASLTLTLCLVQFAPVHADPVVCQERLARSKPTTSVQWLKKQFIEKTLYTMAAFYGLPRYRKLIEEAERSGSYRDDYENFGQMGLAEMGISVRYSAEMLAGLNTGRPLIIVANHHLGIGDGLALQYLVSNIRRNAPSLLFLARWIEKLLPYAVYGDEHRWGTAVPIEINKPSESDPEYVTKMAEVKAFNAKWSASATAVLRGNGALIVFPAGHVASINPGEAYPEGVHDAKDSWQDGFLMLARRTKADIVFAHVDNVNSKAFYRHRKRFGGGDLERVVWFLKEALAKRGKSIDVYLSKPMSVDEVYDTLSARYLEPRETLKADSLKTAELMRRFTYVVKDHFPQELLAVDAPAKRAP